MVHGSGIMPRPPLNVDWSAIRALYVSGLSPIEIGKRFSVAEGTIRARIHREKWNTPPERFASKAISTEKTPSILNDIWAERAAFIREKEFKISEKVLTHAEQMPEDELLKKADGLDKLAKMGRRATGLDSEDKEKTSVNIAVLGDISAMPSESTIYARSENVALGEENCAEPVALIEATE